MWDNVELSPQELEAISAWDIEALLRVYHPEDASLLTGTQVETGGYRGHADGVRAYLEEAEDPWVRLLYSRKIITRISATEWWSRNVPCPRAG